MKKSLLALAVLSAFAGVASAQSSVTLYGIIDVNVQKNDPKPGGVSSTTGINSGHQFGSRLGFRGTEDLGGGLRAFFTLENGFTADNGLIAQTTTTAGTARLFGRQAFAGLGGDWGEVALGRMAAFGSGTGAYDVFSPIDPFGTGFGLSSFASTFSTISITLRPNNMILYRTPLINGFRAGIGHSFQVLTDTEAAGSSNNTRHDQAFISFGSGPFYGAITYDQFKPSDAQKAAGSTNNEKHFQIGATYDIKVVKFHAAYAQQKDEFVGANSNFLAPASTGGVDADTWALGVTVPFAGAYRFLASYQHRDGDTVDLTPTTQFNVDRNVWAVGLIYSASKRTDLYVNYADSKGKGVNGATNQSDNPALSTKQSTIGVSHKF